VIHNCKSGCNVIVLEVFTIAAHFVVNLSFIHVYFSIYIILMIDVLKLRATLACNVLQY